MAIRPEYWATRDDRAKAKDAKTVYTQICGFCGILKRALARKTTSCFLSTLQRMTKHSTNGEMVRFSIMFVRFGGLFVVATLGRVWFVGRNCNDLYRLRLFIGTRQTDNNNIETKQIMSRFVYYIRTNLLLNKLMYLTYNKSYLTNYN